jgi:pimeloyl-ACP methyl ester carboxylesterase
MTSATLESKVYQTKAGTKTHYLQTGDPYGSLIICLHGLGGSVNTFKQLLQFIPKTYNLILVDFPGFGNTPLSNPEPLTIGGHVSDLGDLVAFLQAGSNGHAEGNKVRLARHKMLSHIFCRS